MKFTVRFHDHLINSVQRIVAEYGVPGVVVEIGCFEGDTTFNLAAQMLPLRPSYHHYAIDPYSTSADLPEENIASTRQIFLDNLAEFDTMHPGVVEFVNQDSWTAMVDLYQRGVRADLIYIDGDHRAPAVLEDLVLGFRLLKPGGVIICDDAQVWRYQGSITNSPRMAVDDFLHCYWDRIHIIELPGSYQVAFRRKI